jgi:hypothetical protein
VRTISPEDSEIWVAAPPFMTLARPKNEWWFEKFRHPEEIEYDTAVILGDFGRGSDTPIVLDFSHQPPRVMALSISFHPNAHQKKRPWPEGANYLLEGHWIVLAATFEEFAEKLGLLAG